MNKFLKIIWTINGVVLLLVFLVAGGLVLRDLFRDTYYSPQEIIVGEELEKAKAQGLILQGLTYEEPRPILHTEFYLLPVSIKTYENPKKINKGFHDDRAYNSAYLDSRDIQEYFNVVNVIFLNKDFNTESVLLDKKGFIESIRYPTDRRNYSYFEEEDTLQRHITYKIAFEDSNKDGAIDGGDNSDLYLSELDGKNLRRVTTGVSISNYYFLDTDRIMIKYITRDEAPDEYQKEYFTLYTISKNQLRELTSLDDTLKKIEDNITR